jgi:hypothetical protein
MAVIIGSARIDERGKVRGGSAGDQTGREVSTQAWYMHKLGWRVLRCIDREKAAKIAEAMRSACANPYIGYDQKQRLTLYDAAAEFGFDPGKVKKKVETDCSALVRVCLAYAGIKVGNFRTPTEAAMLLKSGLFEELTGDVYTTSSDFLRVGDILVTPSQGHTVIVLTDGPKAALEDATVSEATEGEDGYITVTSPGRWRIREGRSILSKTVCVVPAGTKLRCYGERDGWYAVQCRGSKGKGWMSAKAFGG